MRGRFRAKRSQKNQIHPSEGLEINSFGDDPATSKNVKILDDSPVPVADDSKRDSVHGDNEEQSPPSLDAAEELKTPIKFRKRLASATPSERVGVATAFRIAARGLPRVRNKRDKIFVTNKEYRPLFVTYLMFVQIVSLAAILSVHDLAPCAFEPETVKGDVTDAFGFTISMQKSVSPNMFLGPPFQTLIQLGAKYGPCIRRFNRVYSHAETMKSNGTLGCCISSTVSGPQCFSTSADGCPAAIGRQWISSVCGGPACCDFPESYPDCTQLPMQSLNFSSAAVCACEIVARPCCVGSPPKCSIRTRSECNFLDGHYAEDAALCSDVDCVEATCGLSKFARKGVPDQWYRFFIAPFLPAGVLHLMLLLVAEMLFVYDLEKIIGWWRVALVFLTTSSGGYLASVIIAPYQVQCGASPGILGLMACLMVELVFSWSQIIHPQQQGLYLAGLVFTSMAIGLLPQVDNIANAIGFILGAFLGLAVLPWQLFRRWSRARRHIAQLTAGAVVFTFAIGGLSTLFSTSDNGSCADGVCPEINCVDITSGWCAATGQRAPHFDGS